MPRGFLISDGLHKDIKRTIARVDGMPDGSDVTRIPTRFETTQQVSQPIRLAAYPRTVTWKQGDTMAISYYTHDGRSFNLVTTEAHGTATALNVCGDFITLPNSNPDINNNERERIGPTPTMAWCIVAKSRNGANVAVEGPMVQARLAAYRLDQGEWNKGERREVSFYGVADGQIHLVGETATVGNVSQAFYPISTASQGTAMGPTPTMAWCVVQKNSDGQLIVTEAENAPRTRLATWLSEPSEWERGSLRTVKASSTTHEYDVYSVFDHYSELDLPHGMVFTRAMSPAGDGSAANVVIGPPPVPLHAVTYTTAGNWARNEEKTVSVLPSQGITQTREIVAVNKHYDIIESGENPLVIGKIGTAYHVIAGPPSSLIKTGERTQYGDKDSPWQRGSSVSVNPVGGGDEIVVKSLFDTYSHLDLHSGVAFVNVKDPDAEGEEGGTVNIVISPAPIPMHVAETTELGTWVVNDQKVLVVPARDNREGPEEVYVTNQFFDQIELDGRPIAIGKFNDQFFALTGGATPSIKTGQRTEFGDKDTPWQRGSTRTVNPAGGGNDDEIDVVSVFDTYSHLDLHNGLAFVRALDPNVAEGEEATTVTIVISPAPIPLHVAETTATGIWSRDDEQVLTVQPREGREEAEQVTVTNKFFDEIELNENKIAIGKFDDQFFALTGESGVKIKLGDLASALPFDMPWQHGESRSVEPAEGGPEVDVTSLFDTYTNLDIPKGLAYAKVKDPADSESTINIVIAPAPIPMHLATTDDQSPWGAEESRIVTVLPGNGRQGEHQVSVTNKFFDSIEPDEKPIAIGKFSDQFYALTGQAAAKLNIGERTEFGDKDTLWQRGATEQIDPAGDAGAVDVKSVFDTYTHLDLHSGVLFSKVRDPDNPESTVNIVISPAPIPLHLAETDETGAWGKDEQKTLSVPAADGRDGATDVYVTNKFFEEIDLAGNPIAIGKFDNQFFALTGQAGDKIRLGDVTTPIESDTPWQHGSTRSVSPADGGPEVDVTSVFDTYTNLDIPNGLAYAKAKDPFNAESTINIVIAPAPIPMHSATTEDVGSWERDAEKVMTVAPYAGRQEEQQVNVTNKFFDEIEVDENPIAIGKFGDQFFALTGGTSPTVKLADRVSGGEWNKGSQGTVKLQGTTTEVQAYNIVGDYSDLDARSSGGVPGLAIVKGMELGGAGGTAWYVVSPPPIVYRSGQFSGPWESGQTKSITLEGSPTGTISVVNNIGTISESGSRQAGFARDGQTWYLAHCGHTSVDVITNVTLEEDGLRFTRKSLQILSSRTATTASIGVTTCSTAVST